MQFRYTASHTAGMPVLQDASGREPQVVLFIRCFRRRFEWQCEDHRFAIRFTVELIAFARFHVRVVTFAVTPLRFFTVHHRPAQTARFVVVIERCQIVTVTATKPCVLFEQPFLQIEAQLAGFIVQLIFRQFGYREFAHFRCGIQHFVQRFATQFRFLRQQIFRPYFFSFEAAGELD